MADEQEPSCYPKRLVLPCTTGRKQKELSFIVMPFIRSHQSNRLLVLSMQLNSYNAVVRCKCNAGQSINSLEMPHHGYRVGSTITNRSSPVLLCRSAKSSVLRRFLTHGPQESN
jgi:hypothetical protein